MGQTVSFLFFGLVALLLLILRSRRLTTQAASSAKCLQTKDQKMDKLKAFIYVDRSGQEVCMDELLPDTISLVHFTYILDLYKYHIRDAYQHVELERFVKIPMKLKSRDPPYLTLEEVIYMDRWIQYV